MAISEKLIKINEEVVAQEDLLVQIQAALQNKNAPNLPTRETWVFALADGSTIEKEVYIDLPKGDIIKVSDSSGVVLWENLDYIEIGTLNVGSKVSLNVNGTARNFIVIQQGNPDATLYDSSCDGTWLLMEDLYAAGMYFDATDADYANSDIHACENGAFFESLDPSIKGAIKTVKIPYTAGTGIGGTLETGSNGLTTQVFSLSAIEVNFSMYSQYNSANRLYNEEGCVLTYFVDAENDDRIAYLNEKANRWHLRSPSVNSTDYTGHVNAGGGDDGYGYIFGTPASLRPAFILSSNMRIVKDSIVSI